MTTAQRIHVSDLKKGMRITATEKEGAEFSFLNEVVSEPDIISQELLKCDISYIYVIGPTADDSTESEEERQNLEEVEHEIETSDYFFSSPNVSDLSEMREIFERIRGKTEILLNLIKNEEKIDTKMVHEISNDLVDACNQKSAIFTALTYLETQEEYSYSHSLNVAIISIALGKRLGKTTDELRLIGLCGLLHDAGMTKISRTLLKKPGKLTEEEYEEIKKHTEYGYKIILQNKELPQEVALVALQHHEKSDGSGYPLGLVERQINNIAKIVAIADVYDAITSKKVYNHERTPSEALKILFSWSGKHFNETLVKFFINTVGIYPVGTLVMLDTGELGVVLELNKKDLTRPKVLIITDNQQQKLEKSHIFDIARYNIKTKKPLKTISSSLNPKKFKINSEEELERFINRFKDTVAEESPATPAAAQEADATTDETLPA